jgi:acyl carrier protein
MRNGWRVRSGGVDRERTDGGGRAMTTSNDEIFEVLCGLLEPFNTQKVDLKPTTDISADLNIDSVSVMDFVMEVEDKYDIDIPLNLLSETRTLQDLAVVVEQRISGS